MEIALSEDVSLDKKEEDFDECSTEDKGRFDRAAFWAATRVNTRLRLMGFKGTFIARYSQNAWYFFPAD